MSKRQQPDQRADNSRRQQIHVGRQRSEKIPHPEVILSWPLNKMVYKTQKSTKV